jgi:hypothetical protein
MDASDLWTWKACWKYCGPELLFISSMWCTKLAGRWGKLYASIFPHISTSELVHAFILDLLVLIVLHGELCVKKIKNRAMDNVHINLPSSQTFRSCLNWKSLEEKKVHLLPPFLFPNSILPTGAGIAQSV